MNRKLYITEAQLKNLIRENIFSEQNDKTAIENSISDDNAIEIIEMLKNVNLKDYDWKIYDLQLNENYIDNLDLKLDLKNDVEILVSISTAFKYQLNRGDKGNYWVPPTPPSLRYISIIKPINIKDIIITINNDIYYLNDDDFGAYKFNIKKIIENIFKNGQDIFYIPKLYENIEEYILENDDIYDYNADLKYDSFAGK